MIQTDAKHTNGARLILGIFCGLAIGHGYFACPSSGCDGMAESQAYDYCWRVDAYRQSAKTSAHVRVGHDDYRGIYDAVCGVGRE